MKTLSNNILFDIKRKLAVATHRGFTMVELIIYMGILVILITMLTGIFTSVIDVQLASESTSSVDQDGRYILARLTHDLDNASSITTPAIPSAQTSPSLQIIINSINYIYSVDASGNLQLTNNNGTDQLNSANTSISGLTFQRLGNGDSNDTVRVGFTVTGRVQRRAGLESKSFQTTLGL